MMLKKNCEQDLIRYAGRANFSGGKAYRVLIDLKGYGHCIYLLLIESLIRIPPGKQRSTLGFPVKLNFSRRERVKRTLMSSAPMLKTCISY